MSESRTQLEEILELLLAEENEKAEELLHEYVVAKARAEYEKVLDEDVSEEEAVEESEESKQNHIIYYKSLSKIIATMENEINDEGEPAVKEHLKSRIDAIEKDRKRIRDLFPDMSKEEWDDNTNWKKSQ